MSIDVTIRLKDKQALARLENFAKQSGVQMSRVEKTAKKTGSRMQAAFGQAGKALGVLGVGAGAAVAIAGLKKVFTETVAFADQIGKLSTRLGESTEFLSDMAFVAERTGVSFQAMTVGIQRANRRIGEARINTGVAKDTFKQLGIALNDAEGRARNFESILPELADKMSNVTDSQEQLRLAMTLFDTEGVSFLQFLKEGSVGIAKLRQLNVQLGNSLSKDTTAKAALAADAMTNFEAALKGVSTSMTVGLLPAVTAFIEEANKMFFNIESNSVAHKRLTQEVNQLEAQIERATNRQKDSTETMGGFLGTIDNAVKSMSEFVGVGGVSEEQLKEWEERLKAARLELKALNEEIAKSKPPPVVPGGDGGTDSEVDAAKILDELSDRSLIKLQSNRELKNQIFLDTQQTVAAEEALVRLGEENLVTQTETGLSAQDLNVTFGDMLTAAIDFKAAMQGVRDFFIASIVEGKKLSAVLDELAKKAKKGLLGGLLGAGIGFIASGFNPAGAIAGFKTGAKAGAGLAEGGTTKESGFHLVGEKGPELAFLPRGTRVRSNQESRTLIAEATGGGGSGSMGGATFNIATQEMDVTFVRYRLWPLIRRVAREDGMILS